MMMRVYFACPDEVQPALFTSQQALKPAPLPDRSDTYDPYAPGVDHRLSCLYRGVRDAGI
jgi:hypothetical protein